jgi:hypothetical protein
MEWCYTKHRETLRLFSLMREFLSHVSFLQHKIPQAKVLCFYVGVKGSVTGNEYKQLCSGVRD